MKKVTTGLYLFAALLPLLAFAQSFDEPDRGVIGLFETEHNGFAAPDLETLVSASDVIVRARYGKFLNNELFYGYRETREQIAKRLNITDDAFMDKLGIPQSEYEILVDEMIKDDGLNPRGMPLTLRVIENLNNPPNTRIANYREGEHLLFLTRNPDNETYGLRGSMFDMKKESDGYSFFFDKVSVSAFGSGKADEFLQEVRELAGKDE